MMSHAVSPLAPKSYAELPPIKGVRFATAEAGIKYKNRTDVLLVVLDKGTEAAGVFTRSKCPSAPVDWCRAGLAAGGKARALLVNSGNANAFTGKRGRETVKLSAAMVAKAVGCTPKQVFLASTGVIGEPLPASKFEGVVDAAAKRVAEGPWLEAAKASPIWKMAMEWKVAFPLHPEYRTLPMVWYVPPLSPITSAASAGKIGLDGEMPDVRSLRIPMRYLANLLTAGNEEPVALALERMLAMRSYMRAKTVDGVIDEAIANRVGLKGAQIDEMYKIMALANYEDRFVIPTAHRELGADAYDMRGSCGFSFGNGCGGGETEVNLFGSPRKTKNPMEVV